MSIEGLKFKNPEDLSLDSLLSILDAQYALYETHKNLYQLNLEFNQNWMSTAETDIAKKCAEESLVLDSYPYFAWKFRATWFHSINTDRFMRKMRPGWERFSSLDFECLVRAILFLTQKRIYKLTKASGDGGVDLVYDERHPMGGGYWNARTVVQCKLYHGPLPVGEVRDFFGAMTANVADGYLFTTGTLTKSGFNFIETANRSPHANSYHFVTKEQIDKLLNICDEIHAEEDKEDAESVDYELLEELSLKGKIIMEEKSK